MMNVLTCYSLPSHVVTQLEAEGGELRYLTLSTLRVASLPDIWRTLRTSGPAETRVVVSEANERVVLPILLTLASFMPVQRISVLDLSIGRLSRVWRVRAFLGVFSSIAATLAGYWHRLLIDLRTRYLLRAKPLGFGRIGGSKALYLKTNLMFGTHAGGSVGHIAGVINELDRRGGGTLVHAVEFPQTVNSTVRFEALPGIKYYGIPPESNQLRFNNTAIRHGMRALRRERFDFIYQRMTLANLAGVVLSRAFKVPLILEYNGSEVWVSRHWGLPLKWEALAERIEQVCIRHAARIVTVSNPLCEDLIRRGVEPERIVTYPNCIEPEIFNPVRLAPERDRLRRGWGVGDDELVAMFVGTFGRWHGADVLAEAIDQWRASADGRKIRFVLVGDGLLAPEIRERLTEATAARDVIFTGLISQHETPAYLAAADICLSPHLKPSDGSRFFGSPTKLFEYMAMAKPIIASRLEQLEEVLGRQREDEREIAVLVDPGSAQAIVDALAVLADNAELRESLGASARVRALGLYTWERHVDEILRSLRDGL
jgi:glycosyltransferase involved in cell wall biosynthesis